MNTVEDDLAGLPAHLLPTADPSITPAQSAFLRLRALSALESWRCCRSAGFRIAQAVWGAADVLKEAYERPDEPLMAFVAPGRGAVMVARYLGLQSPETISLAPVFLGAVVGAATATATMPQTKHAMEVAVSALKAIAETVQQSISPNCYQCTLEHMLGHRKKRSTGVWTENETGARNALRARIPHKWENPWSYEYDILWFYPYY
jgi:hypothetical protein